MPVMSARFDAPMDGICESLFTSMHHAELRQVSTTGTKTNQTKAGRTLPSKTALQGRMDSELTLWKLAKQF